MAIRLRVEHTRFPHLGGHSGYVQFVRHLDPARFAVNLHGASDSDADLPSMLTPFAPLLRRFIERGNSPWYKLSDLTAEAKALPACLTGRVDIVHFLDGEHSARYLPRLIKWSRISKVRAAATFHQPPGVAREVVDGTLLRWLDRVVLVSPAQVPFFEEFLPRERIRVLMHGVDTDFFHPAPRPGDDDRIRIVTVGHWLRDVATIRTVIATLGPQSGVHFDVVGGGEIEVSARANVTLHRAIDDAALAALYRSADVLFLPLTDATANNALLEGMASGLAVLTSDLPSVRAYLPAEDGMLLDDGADGFIDALRRLCRDADLRHMLGRRARRRAEMLAWPRLIGDYDAFYGELLADGA